MANQGWRIFQDYTTDEYVFRRQDGNETRLPLPVAAGTVDIEDEGAAEGAADTIDFVGAGVSVSFAGGEATVTIPGTVNVEDEGAVEGAADTIDFTGAGVSVSFAGGQATVDIPGGGSGVDVEEEGVAEGTASVLDFTGAGVDVTYSGGTATIDIPGGGSGVEVEEEGVTEGTAATLDFTGAGVDVSFASGTATVDIPGVGSSDSVEGTDGATAAPGAATYGAFSTPWTVTVNVESGDVVDLHAMVNLMCNQNVVMYVAFRRGSTTIYENPHYIANPTTQANALHHHWRDESPGTGSVTYEIYVAPNSAATITLKNGATLDTTAQLTQGKSIFTAWAHQP